MQIWTNLVLVLQVVAAITMIGLVLVQHGKGADMGASFGSGASGSLFGATGSANFLSRFTAVCAGVFFVCTLSLAYFSNSVASRAPSSGGSVLTVLQRRPARRPARRPTWVGAFRSAAGRRCARRPPQRPLPRPLRRRWRHRRWAPSPPNRRGGSGSPPRCAQPQQPPH